MADYTAASIAIQDPSNPQPTNKVSASTTVGGGLGAAMAGVYLTFGDNAVREILAPMLVGKPDALNFITAMIGVAAVYAVTKYGGQAAAYNVLDKPNIPLAQATPTPPQPVPNPAMPAV